MAAGHKALEIVSMSDQTSRLAIADGGCRDGNRLLVDIRY